VLLPWIGLGLQLKIAIVRDEIEIAAASPLGPTRADEEVVCELQWKVPIPRFVTGRFVLRDGRAWPACTVSAYTSTVPSSTPNPLPRDFRVESDGRFRFEVREALPVGGSRSLRFFAPHPDNGGRVFVRVALDQELPVEGLELGDIILDRGDLLVSGRVVDPSQIPVTGATFSLHARSFWNGEEFWPQVIGSNAVQTDGNGAFAIYQSLGEALAGSQLRLTSSADGFAEDRDRVVGHGERDILVVLARAGALAGSLELSEKFAPEDLALILKGATRQNFMLKPDATFEARNLLPGSYSLEVVRSNQTGRAVLKPGTPIEGLLVREGETCRDPRIQSLRIE
jgi:hypothetical protein